MWNAVLLTVALFVGLIIAGISVNQPYTPVLPPECQDIRTGGIEPQHYQRPIRACFPASSSERV